MAILNIPQVSLWFLLGFREGPCSMMQGAMRKGATPSSVVPVLGVRFLVAGSILKEFSRGSPGSPQRWVARAPMRVRCSMHADGGGLTLGSEAAGVHQSSPGQL